jgi:hypothetical protein
MLTTFLCDGTMKSRAIGIQCSLLIAYDLWSTGKFQRATLWASVFLVVLQQVRSPIGRTVPSQAFATWMQNFALSLH